MRVQTEVVGGIEATDASLASKGDHVGTSAISILQVPVIVAPNLAGLAHTSLRLVNDERDALSLS